MAKPLAANVDFLDDIGRVLRLHEVKGRKHVGPAGDMQAGFVNEKGETAGGRGWKHKQNLSWATLNSSSIKAWWHSPASAGMMLSSKMKYSKREASLDKDSETQPSTEAPGAGAGKETVHEAETEEDRERHLKKERLNAATPSATRRPLSKGARRASSSSLWEGVFFPSHEQKREGMQKKERTHRGG